MPCRALLARDVHGVWWGDLRPRLDDGGAAGPRACEADVYGAVTNLIQDVADAPIFMVDLVDLDAEDDTGVVWHCGQAPISMAAETASDGHGPLATIHTNRRMPLPTSSR